MKIEKRNLERSFRIEEIREEGREKREVSAALSSETPVQQYFGKEILVHEKGAINMERAANGLPLLFSHDRDQPIGVVRDIRLDSDKVLRGTLKFSNNAKANEVWRDVSEGFLRDLSLGYSIDEYEEEDDDRVRVTRFTPLEASVVTVPADSRVGVNRNHEGKAMSDDKKPDDAGTDSTETRQHDNVADYSAYRINQNRERREGAKLEAKRRADIRSLFGEYEAVHGDSFADLCEWCTENPEVDVTRAKEEILNAIAKGYVSVDVGTRQDEGSHFSGLPTYKPTETGRRAVAGEDAIDKYVRAAGITLSVQSNGVYTEEERQEVVGTEFASMGPVELAREYLRIIGRKPVGGREDIIGAAFQRDISHGTSHFANILENVASKSLLNGFSEAPESWSTWCQTKNVPDFKASSLLNTSLFSDLDLIREMGQYEYGDLSDIKETITLATYGKLFGISRQALANDDLSALSDIPMKMGRAAARKIGDLAYSVLTTNAALNQDSTELFHANHSNYVTAGAAPSVTTLEAGRTAMALQTDPSGATLGIRPAYLIVPEALRSTANVLMSAQYDPAGTAGTLTPNTVQGTMTVVSDHRLDTANSSGWYLAAMTDTVVVGFLNGQQTPYLESKDGWTMDGVEYKVRIDAASVAADYRGLYYNDGVT